MSSTDCDSLKFTFSAREIKKSFCKVYASVISSYFTFNADLISSTKAILNSKKERKKFKNDSPSYQLAFLLSFGIQDTCTVARKFYESIKNHTEVIKKISENNPIKLLCLESESLPSVIGVCQVINEVVKEFEPAGNLDFREIQISIIDNRKNWKQLCEFIISQFNSYFTNIKLKLDFEDNFISLTYQEFINRIQELDMMIVARCFSEYQYFTKNYNLMKVILDEMKEDSILFYYDSYNKQYYTSFKHLISMTSFFEVKCCENLHVLFEDLKDEQYYLDLPVSWDTDFQSVMFSTWIKNAAQKASISKVDKQIAFNQLNLIKSTEKIKDEKIPSGNVFHSEKPKTSASGQTNTVESKKKIKSSAEKCNKSDMPQKRTIISVKKKLKSSIKPRNQLYPSRREINVVSGKQKVKSSIKQCNSDIATKTKVEKKSHTQKTHEVLNTIISILNKQTTDSKTTELSQKSQCSNVSRDAAISQNVIARTENLINSANELVCEGSTLSTTQTIQQNEKAKTAISKNSTSCKTKSIYQEYETVLPRNVSASPSVLKGTKEKRKSSEKSTKFKPNLEATSSDEEFETKSINWRPPTTATSEIQGETAVPVNLPKKSTKKNATLTKKSSKNNATGTIKLTGKFAHMDLEKRNKDERHKMRAKKASLAKHASFDYGD